MDYMQGHTNGCIWDVFAKVQVAPNDNGCDTPDLKDDGVPDKCDGEIIPGQDNPPEEPDVD